MITFRCTVPPDWIDFNGHMRDGYYVLAVSYANDATMEALGLGPAYLAATQRTLYNLDNHTRFLAEAYEGDAILVEMWLVDADEKRLHLVSRISREADGVVLAENAAVLMHISRQGARPSAAPFPVEIKARVDAMLAEHRTKGMPEFASTVGLSRKVGP
ncbi:MAG: thioesterase family protein [Pseudomonadota bacterium]